MAFTLAPLPYANDDDGDRKAGSDSRLLFTAPANGAYLVRVRDSRGLGGDRFCYDLVVREAREDFSVRLDTGLTLNVGSGQSFSVTADRRDGGGLDVAGGGGHGSLRRPRSSIRSPETRVR